MSFGIEAITLDFFNTLAFHRGGVGRGRLLVEYFEAQGYSPGPWAHSILYDVFEDHHVEYSPLASQRDKEAHYARLTERVMDGLGIPDPASLAQSHAMDVWRILGPERFDVFPDVREALRELTGRRLPLAIVSNWQCGLRHFVDELGLADVFGEILASAELGVAKPDARIFTEACRRLGVSPARTLHVGDTMVDDYSGGIEAGMQVVLLSRVEPAPEGVRAIRSLSELPDLLGYDDRT